MSDALRMVARFAFCFTLSACSDVSGSGGSTAPQPVIDLSTTLNEPVTRSYEVAIASAAADQIRGLEDCGARPKAEQAGCRKQVNDAYESARSAAMVIRGTDR